jgi:eukaryotic-like serine/threonine-protein kinase
LQRPALRQPEPGVVVADRYEIREILERRHGATVVKARQLALQRPCVLKLLPLAHDPVIAARFTREAEALGRLNHPSCVDVFDHGVWDGWLFLAVAWVDGPSLRALVGAPWDPLEAVQVALDLARGLEHAHARGVAHRDIQPSRVVLSGEPGAGRRAHLVDFGLARIEDQEPDTTAGRSPVGAPGYLAPERLEGDRGGPAGDVYAVGVLLFEMLTGRNPFLRATPVETLAAQVAGDAPPLERALPRARRTEALCWVVDRATRPSPSQRLPDGAALTRALLAARASLVDPALTGAAPWLDAGRVHLPPGLGAAVELSTPVLLSRRVRAPELASPAKRGAAVGVIVGVGVASLAVVAFVALAAVALVVMVWL